VETTNSFIRVPFVGTDSRYTVYAYDGTRKAASCCLREIQMKLQTSDLFLGTEFFLQQIVATFSLRYMIVPSSI
jgi:hypothetical protein